MNREFRLFQSLIREKAGISLRGAKRSLLEARLGNRVRELGFVSFTAYYRYVVAGHEDELVQMLDRISTNETRFFREPQQFDFLAGLVLNDWTAQASVGLRSRRIRAWSAGCSSGEEPYSLAMVLWRYLPPSAGWKVQILATDISTRVLKTARKGIWPLEKAKDIPPDYLKRFMLKGTGNQEGRMKADSEIRSAIRFDRLNLNDEIYRVSLFDLILCRNVLIYFDHQRRTEIVNRLLAHLRPGGIFLIGHSETLTGVTDKLSYIMPTIYVRIGEANSGGMIGVEQQEARACR